MFLNHEDFVSNTKCVTMLACGQVRDQLVSLQKEVSAAQPAVDQLIDDSHNCRRLTEKSRVNVHRGGPHIDLDRVDSDVNRITQRWNNICSQLVDRSVTMKHFMISANKGAYDGCSDYRVDTGCRLDSANRSRWHLPCVSLASTERYSRSSSITAAE